MADSCTAGARWRPRIVTATHVSRRSHRHDRRSRCRDRRPLPATAAKRANAEKQPSCAEPSVSPVDTSRFPRAFAQLTSELGIVAVSVVAVCAVVLLVVAVARHMPVRAFVVHLVGLLSQLLRFLIRGLVASGPMYGLVPYHRRVERTDGEPDIDQRGSARQLAITDAAADPPRRPPAWRGRRANRSHQPGGSGG
jgi:hypothetical protein